MNDSTITRYQKKRKSILEMIIVSMILLCFLFIASGTVFKAAQISQGDSRNNIFLFCLTLSIGFFLLLFIYLIFKIIDKVNINKQFINTFVLFAVYTLIIIWMAGVIDVHPQTDSSTDIDTGWYLNGNPLTNDNYHTHWLNIYPNNYMMILVFKGLARIAGFFNITDFVSFLTVVNACVMAGGLVLTFLTALSLWGIKTANKILLLMVLNPVYYYITFWIYTTSFSVPLMMGLIFVLVRFDKAGTVRRKIICCVIIGVLMGAGYHIRPTAVFPVAAYMILVLVRFIRGEYRGKSGRWMRFFIYLGIAVGVFIIIYKIGDIKIESIFSENRKENFSPAQWLYMGSHGNGNLSTLSEDTGYVVDEKAGNTYFKGVIYNYKKLGIAGTADLWLRKTLTVFSDARSAVTSASVLGASFNGNKQKLVEGFLLSVYACAYRMVVYLGIILSCVNHLRKKQKDDHVLLFLFILFTGILFYFVWEAKGVYNLVFLPAMALASEKGLDVIYERKYLSKNSRRVLPGLIAGAVVAVNSLVLWSVLSQSVSYEYIRVNGDTYARSDDKIKLVIDENTTLSQDFKCTEPFNNILIKSSSDDNESEISDYTIKLYDKDDLILTRTVNKNDINDNNISLELDKRVSGSSFTLNIEKNMKSDGNLVFYTGKNYYLDSYEGTLQVGNENYTDDLSMIVRETGKSQYLPFKSRLLVVGIMDIMCISGVLGYVFWAGSGKEIQESSGE